MRWGRVALWVSVLLTLLAGRAQSATDAPRREVIRSDPSQDPDSREIWPNRTSRANGDRWLVDNHDRIRRMQPRLLVLNFSNQASRERLDRMLGDLVTALGEGSRHHGYRESNAPVFLDYRLFRFVDLRDADRREGNSRLTPLKNQRGFNMDYRQYFSDAFAARYGVPDPSKPGRHLRLDELIDRGFVHEVWFFAEHTPDFGAYESVELKPQYNEAFGRVEGKFVQAGNGGDAEQPWTGRSVRIAFINPARGIGCFLESLSHSFEGMANSGAIPYLTRYFREFAGFDLDRRWGLPFASLYPPDEEGVKVEYPDDHTAVVRHGGRTWRLAPYVAAGGNVHFLPNGRQDYDLDNAQPVLSTIEDWRIGSGEGGRDRAKPWSIESIAAYRRTAPDCMGPWLIYWRQNLPGLDNRARDDAGRPMKNWWPFLFY